VPPGKYVRWLDFGLPAAVGLLVLGALALVSTAAPYLEGAGKSFAFGLGAGIALNFVRRPLRFALALGAIVLAASVPFFEENTVLRQDRSFFGVVRVERSGDGRLNEMIHGTTTHGAQFLDPAHRKTPLTYFHPTGPAGQLMSAVSGPRLRRVAVIGLGTGSLGCYSRRGDHWTFFELDPTVERIARDPRLFTYLRDCDGRFDVVRGDARLSLERARPHEFGLLVADAFSSDAVPTHLLTREALRLYRSKLRPGGVLAFHISNRFLDLQPVLGEVAAAERLTCLAQNELPTPHPPRGKRPSHWVVMAARPSDLGALTTDRRWRRCRRTPGRDAWSDNFSSPVSALGRPGSG
jgi:spermidine synthase